MESRVDTCDSCYLEGATLACETCPRLYHSECFTNSQFPGRHGLKQCYKCVLFGSKPIQIAEFMTTYDQDGKKRIKPLIYSDRISKIIKDSKAEKLPVLIIAVAGVARSGKSFLLNLMIDRNIHHIKHGSSEWTTSKSHISGFNWAQSDTAVTFGIWMWERAIITELNDGTKVAILYMDTQGTADRVESTDPATDTLIMYLSLEIATIQIHNINQTWRIEDTRVYEVCKLYGELSSKAEQKPFNHLILMHRNWQNDDEYGWRMNYYEEELKKVAKNPDAWETLKGIKASFQSVDFAMLPTPGSKVTSSKKNLTIKDIKPKFLKSLESVFDVLYNQKQSMHDFIRRCKRGEDVIRVIKELKARVENEDMPPIGTPAEHLADSLNSQAYTAAMLQFENDVSKISADDGIKKYIKRIDNSISTAEEVFQRMAVKKQQFHRVYRLYEKKLKDDLTTKKAALVTSMELIIMQKNNEELRLQNLLGKKYQEALVAWERDVKMMNAEDTANLTMYKRKLAEVSSRVSKQFSEDVKKLNCADKSLCHQLSQALQEKEDSAFKRVENEHTIQRIQKDLVKGKSEQEKKDREFQELQRKQREGEVLSQKQQEKLDNYKKDTDEQKKINENLQSQLDQQNKQKERERIQMEEEITAAKTQVQMHANKVSEIEEELKSTKSKLCEQERKYHEASSARGTTSESIIGNGLRILAGWADRLFSWIGG